MVYVISSGIMGSGVMIIQGNAWLRLVLLILNLALFVFIYCAIAFKDGEKALRVRTSNDKLRELIVQTGDDYKLDLDGEFTVIKGFIIGATTCLPLIILILLNLLVGGKSGSIIMTIQLFYMAFLGFFNLDFAEVYEEVLYSSCYWALIAIPVLIILQGVFFYLGGRNAQAQIDKIKNSNKTI